MFTKQNYPGHALRMFGNKFEAPKTNMVVKMSVLEKVKKQLGHQERFGTLLFCVLEKSGHGDPGAAND
jgi:hypothetical protein